MNEELIKRLADEAGLTCDALPPWMTDYGYSKDEILKFVALVAEECAKVAENTLESDFDENDKYATTAATAIRSTFPPKK